MSKSYARLRKKENEVLVLLLFGYNNFEISKAGNERKKLCLDGPLLFRYLKWQRSRTNWWPQLWIKLTVDNIKTLPGRNCRHLGSL